MDAKQVVLWVLGIGVVAFIIYKLQPSEGQTIQSLVPVGSVPNQSNTDVHAVYETNKTQAFTALLGLGQSQQSADVAGKSIDNSVTLENIRAKTVTDTAAIEGNVNLTLGELAAGVQRALGMYDYEKTVAGYERDTELMGLQTKSAEFLAGLQSDTQLALQRDYLASVIEQLGIQTQARKDEVANQISAVASVGQQYRNQSLERQGTILNALASIWGQNPYSYQEAFGGPRPPTFMQQLSGLVSSVAQASKALFPWGI
jgi:hypothetical protein